MNKAIAKGFTLIELLIVIGILAILATVTLLVLNPAQMFAQARDSQRISDLNTIKSAVSLYLSTASLPYLDNATGADCTAGKLWGTFGSTTVFTTAHNSFKGAVGTTSVDGTGWVPVAFSTISGGSPLTALPLDPSGVIASSNSNTAPTYGYFYTCSTTGMTFELDANLESTRFAKDGTDDKESTDGGDKSYMYETGTSLNL
jgi:prepilin-type N-terminal cleavage/methylation domain-containing protein